MTSPGYALIGRSFPSELYDRLYQLSLAARADRRAHARRGCPVAGKPLERRWRGCGDAVVMPRRLGA